MKLLIALVVSMSVFSTASHAATTEEVVGICGPNPANYPVGSEWICELNAHVYAQVQAGEPPAPAPASCTLGTFPDYGTIFYPDGIHAWYTSGDVGVVRVDRLITYTVTNTTIRVVDDSGLTHILATGFPTMFSARTCLHDLIAARRL